MLLTLYRNDNGVYQLQKPVVVVAVYNHNALQNSHLRRRKSYSGVVHGVRHIVKKLPQFLVELCDLLAFLPQYLVAELQYLQNCHLYSPLLCRNVPVLRDISVFHMVGEQYTVQVV